MVGRVEPIQPSWLTKIGRLGRKTPNIISIIGGVLALLAGQSHGVFKYVLLACFILGSLSAIVIIYFQQRQDEADKLQESQEVRDTIDEIATLAIQIKNCLTPDSSNSGSRGKKIPMARHALLNAVTRMVGDRDARVRANLFVPDKKNTGEFRLAPNGFCGRGQESTRVLCAGMQTYDHSIKGETTFSNDPSIFTESGQRYSAYATAPILGGLRSDGTADLFGIITVDTKERGHLDEEKDPAMLLLMANFLAMTFISGGNDPHNTCQLDTENRRESD